MTEYKSVVFYFPSGHEERYSTHPDTQDTKALKMGWDEDGDFYVHLHDSTLHFRAIPMKVRQWTTEDAK